MKEKIDIVFPNGETKTISVKNKDDLSNNEIVEEEIIDEKDETKEIIMNHLSNINFFVPQYKRISSTIKISNVRYLNTENDNNYFVTNISDINNELIALSTLNIEKPEVFNIASSIERYLDDYAYWNSFKADTFSKKILLNSILVSKYSYEEIINKESLNRGYQHYKEKMEKKIISNIYISCLPPFFLKRQIKTRPIELVKERITKIFNGDSIFKFANTYININFMSCGIYNDNDFNNDININKYKCLFTLLIDKSMIEYFMICTLFNKPINPKIFTFVVASQFIDKVITSRAIEEAYNVAIDYVTKYNIPIVECDINELTDIVYPTFKILNFYKSNEELENKINSNLLDILNDNPINLRRNLRISELYNAVYFNYL